MNNIDRMPLKPVEKDSLYTKIADSIYEYIRKNELKPGERLPSERKMAETLNTSRNSLREGLRVLETRGILKVKVGSGVYLADQQIKKSRKELNIDDVTTEEMQELQTILDHQAVLNAIARGTSVEKEKLIKIGEEMLELYSNSVYSHSLDYSFHDTLYRMGKNTAVRRIINFIRDERFVRREESDQDNNSVWLKTVPEHLILAKAIWDCDEAEAIKAMDEILDYGFSLFEDVEHV